MTHNPLRRLWQYVEPWFFCWVILQYAGLALDPPIASMVNALNYVLTVPLVLNHWHRLRSAGIKDISLLLLHALAIASLLWSGSPDATLDRLKALIRTTILGISFAVAYTPKQQTQLLLRTALIAGVLSLLTILAFPSVGIAETYLKGIFSFKNGLGLMMAIGGMLAFNTAFNQKRHRGLLLVGFCGAAILLFFSRSATSLIGLIIAILVIPLHPIVKQHYKLRTALSLLTLLIGVGTIILLSSNLETIAGWFGKDLTLTGRSTLWDAIIQAGFKHPWIGYGYGAFWFTNESIEAISINGWPNAPLRGEYLTTFHSHSGYIEFFTNLGFVGLAIFALNFLATFFRVIHLFRTTKTVESLWMLQLLLLMLLINYSEVGTILAPNQTLWILYVSVSMTSLIQKEKIQKLKVSRKINAPAALT